MAQKTYTLGGHEIVLETPSVDAWDRYSDSGDDISILLLECVKSPSQETLARILASKPAYKQTLRNLLAHMAGADATSERLESDDPGVQHHRIGQFEVSFRPATEQQFDDARDLMQQGRHSDAAGRLVKACLVSPSGEEFDNACQQMPALKYLLEYLLLEEAGAFEEAVEKK